MEMNVRITLKDEMLGTAPQDKGIYRSYIASKAPDAATVEEEVATIGVDAVAEKGTTVFRRDKDGNLILLAYMVKGFFKAACDAMRRVPGSESANLKAYVKVIDKLVFVNPDHIIINLPEDGEVEICERPLRRNSPMGEMVALASSESVPAGSTMEFTVEFLDPGLEKYIVEWLNYGKYNGLGSWRNSGKGRFTWVDLNQTERATDKKKVVIANKESNDTTVEEAAPAPKKRGRKPKNAVTE